MPHQNSDSLKTPRPAQHRHVEFDRFRKANRAELNGIEQNIIDLHGDSVAIARELRKIKTQQLAGLVTCVATVIGLTIAHHHKK